jgi:mRNA deadenylase 3'-5' endonuclease subunit Ccr4
MTVAREIATYKLDLVCVQEVRWDKGDKMGLQEVGWGGLGLD